MRPLLFATSSVTVAACANLLSYDDYKTRSNTADSAIIETSIADTRVEDTPDSGPPPARLPPRPAGEAKPSTTGKTLWLAARSYSFGLTDTSGVDSEGAWATYGYDLDETCTSERDSIENLGTCLRPAGAPQESLIDGERCRDNNFERYVSILLRTSLPTAETTLNGLVGLGSPTWILKIDDVDMTADDPYAPGVLYRTGDDRMRMPAPAWDGNDARTMQPISVEFPRGYITNGTWVSGEPTNFDVVVPVTAIASFTMKLAPGAFTLELNAERTSGQHGLLIGAVRASEVEALLKPIADFAGVCPGTAIYNNMLNSAMKMPDVVIGAPKLQDLSRTCDGISSAIGFEVIPIKPITENVPLIPPRNPKCADAG